MLRNSQEVKKTSVSKNHSTAKTENEVTVMISKSENENIVILFMKILLTRSLPKAFVKLDIVSI